jgi:hypothetical protein
VTDSSLLEGDALERLKLAAEEIAFLSGRGYPASDVNELVTRHRALLPEQRALLERAVCSETQYKQRALKEMLPEDISRRPLLVDGHDLVDAVCCALAGAPLLEGIDQTVQPLSPGGSPAHVRASLDLIGPALREMRPSKTKWLLDTSRADAPALRDELVAASKKWKVAVEVELVADPKTTLRRSANVVSNDPSVIDACKTWCNVAGPIVLALPNARRVKLQ